MASQVDNTAPPTPDEVLLWLRGVALQFPGAAVSASSLDDFVLSLSPQALAALPVITSEIGDTWVR
jgi:hypothetical protein